MAIKLIKQETLARIKGSPKVHSTLFLNPISGADKNELRVFMDAASKSKNGFVVTIID